MIRWFLFVFCFTAEIHVRAGEVLERPAACLRESSTCAIQTKKSVFHFKQTEIDFHLGERSLIVRKSAEEIDFLNGTFWAQEYRQLDVGTLYGRVRALRGPFWVLGEDDKVWVRNVNADLEIILRDGRKIELPVGFQIWIGGADTEGQNTLGIPEAIPVESHIRLWSRMYEGKKEDFASEVDEIRLTWGPLPERAAQLYTSIAERQKGLADERTRLARQRKIAAEDQTKKIRDLYYQKTFWR